VWAIAAGDAEAHQNTVDLWNEANPDNPIAIEELPEDADGQREQVGLEMDAGRDHIDVINMDMIWTGEFALNSWLEPLEDLRDEVEGVSLEQALETAEYEGTLWGLPYNTNAGFLYYRTDLVDEPPSTWQEMVEAGMEVADPDAEQALYPYVAQGAQYEGLTVNFLELYWAMGGELYNEDWTEVRFGEDDTAVEALTYLAQLQQEGFLAAGFNTMQEEDSRIEFQQGGAVFLRNWPYVYLLASGEIEEEASEVADSFDIAPLPAWEGGGDPVPVLGGFNLGVSAFSDNKELAKEFVLFAATDEEVQRGLAEDSLAPSMNSVREEYAADDEMFALVNDMLEHARPRPPVPEYGEVSIAIQQAVFQAYNGELEPEAAVQEIRDAMDQGLQVRREAQEVVEEEQADDGS
jgi:multiple sugar transport system substrate-binding protein